MKNNFKKFREIQQKIRMKRSNKEENGNKKMNYKNGKKELVLRCINNLSETEWKSAFELIEMENSQTNISVGMTVAMILKGNEDLIKKKKMLIPNPNKTTKGIYTCRNYFIIKQGKKEELLNRFNNNNNEIDTNKVNEKALQFYAKYCMHEDKFKQIIQEEKRNKFLNRINEIREQASNKNTSFADLVDMLNNNEDQELIDIICSNPNLNLNYINGLELLNNPQISEYTKKKIIKQIQV